MKLKPLSEQIIVVTGAASGLGLAIARRAAEVGASVMLIDRDEPAVRQAAADINIRGGRAHPVAGDPTDPADAARLARTAIARFGGFDSWINVVETEAAAANCAREAARHYRQRGGGAIVNLATAAAATALRQELKALAGPLALTSIILPKGWSPAENLPAAAGAALDALTRRIGKMSVVPGGRLSLVSQAQKHRALVLGVGMVALAAAAAWYGRGRIGAVAKPVLRKTLTRAVTRHPVRAARIAVRHPRQSLKLARFALR